MTSPNTPSVAPSSAAGVPVSKLVYNTGAFAFAFAMWVMLGPSSGMIANELGISVATATSLKATPVLLGAALRIPVGIAANRLGARRVFPAVILIACLGAVGLSFAQTLTQLTLASLLMGVIGTCFAVGVQSVSSWTPTSKQGLALGIFGAGNVGTAMTTLCMPWMLTEIGWRASFRLYAAVLVAVALAYYGVMHDAPRRAPAPTFGALLKPLTDGRAWRFGLYYVATFGTFVATTLLISDIYREAFRLSLTDAGLAATTFTFTASLTRIPGGKWADRYGARRVLNLSLWTVALALLPVGLQLSMVFTVGLVFIAGAAMGVGMAATFRYIPDFYPSRVGAVGGIVGALGGLGGFALPLLCAFTKTQLGFAQAQVLPVAAVAVAALWVQYAASGDERAPTAAAARQSAPAGGAKGALEERASALHGAGVEPGE